MTGPFPCVDPNHFEVLADGSIRPQPWMAWRQVAGVSVPSKAGTYGATLSSSGLGGIEVFGTLGSLFGSLFSFIPQMFGNVSFLAGLASSASAGGNKNELLHQLTTAYTNTSPVPQDVYGLITRGGARVTLQARSRGGLVVSSGYKLAVGDPGPLVPASMFGCGGDIGRGGTLAIGTQFCVVEERMNSVTFPLAPERTGRQRVNPGQTITARAEVRFVSEFWENTTIDGGDSGAESSYETGDTALNLFAVPVI